MSIWLISLLIFLARICDVSIGTVRTIFVISGHRFFATFLGFFEVTIWVLAVGGVIQHLDHAPAIIAYAAGYACGVLVGMTIEDRLAIGHRIVRVISPDTGVNLSQLLRDRGFRVTRVDGKGRDGPVEIAFLVVKRKDLRRVRTVVGDIAPEAFLMVEQVTRPAGAGFSESRFARGPRGGMVRK